MNNLNTIKKKLPQHCVVTFCNEYSVVPVCMCRCLSHDTCTLIPDGWTGHNVSLQEFGE